MTDSEIHVDLEVLRLDLIGAYQTGSLTYDLVDDVVGALEHYEELKAEVRKICSWLPGDDGRFFDALGTHRAEEFPEIAAALESRDGS